MMAGRLLLRALLASLCLPARAFSAAPAWDTSKWVGAEYTPWRASNELWWHDYASYRADVARELPLIREVLGFSALRVWVHSMLHADNATALKAHMDDFMALADQSGIGIGWVFFDDCWNRAGADLARPCVPRKGVHNGCWMASPQDVERTSIGRFEPYVRDLVSTFRADRRVLWWEIYNEPQLSNNFSAALRTAAYGWAKAESPSQPVASCWDDSADTDLVDSHQYNMPWGKRNKVFRNPGGAKPSRAAARTPLAPRPPPPAARAPCLSRRRRAALSLRRARVGTSTRAATRARLSR